MSIVGTYEQVMDFIEDIVDCLDSRPKFIYFPDELRDWEPEKGKFYFVLTRIPTVADFNIESGSTQPLWTYSVTCLILRTSKVSIDINPKRLREYDVEGHSTAQEFVLKLKENTLTKNSPVNLESVSVEPVLFDRTDLPYGVSVSFDLIVPDGYCFC